MLTDFGRMRRRMAEGTFSNPFVKEGYFSREEAAQAVEIFWARRGLQKAKGVATRRLVDQD